MATWIVHLRLAENLLEKVPGLAPEAFSVGSIAPDSGIPDENWENFNPPPEISHYQDSNHERWTIADLEFCRNYLSTDAQTRKDVNEYSFLLGYFFHLVTDNLWADRIGRPTMEKFQEEFEDDPKFIWQVKRDWYGLDLEHVRKNPGSIYWRTFIPIEFNEEYLDFMPLKAIQDRIKHIKDLYQRTDDEIEEWYGNRPDLYLSKVEMDEFIELTTGILYKIYEMLIIQKPELENRFSILEVEELGL